ncbi:hypothetical protein K4K52_009245 [Colletotrichum sp. SAR 10_76]|nr:hypothetical protein K4K51_006279 [Colletotrichum sp. SAR 10_75]KAI8211899.1 hypothetical protein K4K52_009245 [Colletotrichum sp. SAR 10_76]KAI8304702.1 hypothetical protein K4K59_012664 [Colletotrichum sp. SAR11_240]
MRTSIVSVIVGFAALAAASPMPEPTAPPAVSDCTITVTHFDPGFTGDFQPTTTITQYNSTVTAPNWGGHGPAYEKVIYVPATVPTTVTSPVCATPTAF